MPSTPTLYWMPRKAIQSACWTSWKPGWLLSKLTATSSEMTKARPAVASARKRMRRDALPGHEAQDDGAHQRRDDEQREEVRTGQEVVEHQRASRMKRAIMTTRPMAMPSA